MVTLNDFEWLAPQIKLIALVNLPASGSGAVACWKIWIRRDGEATCKLSA